LKPTIKHTFNGTHNLFSKLKQRLFGTQILYKIKSAKESKKHILCEKLSPPPPKARTVSKQKKITE
jgi:hypothetical protein